MHNHRPLPCSSECYTVTEQKLVRLSTSDVAWDALLHQERPETQSEREAEIYVANLQRQRAMCRLKVVLCGSETIIHRPSTPSTPLKPENASHESSWFTILQTSTIQTPPPPYSEETDSCTCHTAPSLDSPDSPDDSPDSYRGLPNNNMKDPIISSYISHLHPPREHMDSCTPPHPLPAKKSQP